MRRRTLTTLSLAVLLILPAALLRAADAPKVQDKDLEGAWQGVSAVLGGKELPPPPGGMPGWTFKGEAVSMGMGDDTHTGTFKADASKTPKTLDVVSTDRFDEGKTVRAIYEVKGDELRICAGSPGNKDRPTEFTAKEGDGYALLTFKRVKK